MIDHEDVTYPWQTITMKEQVLSKFGRLVWRRYRGLAKSTITLDSERFYFLDELKRVEVTGKNIFVCVPRRLGYAYVYWQGENLFVSKLKTKQETVDALLAAKFNNPDWRFTYRVYLRNNARSPVILDLFNLFYPVMQLDSDAPRVYNF